MEEEQTLEELQSLRDVVQDWFRKQEEIAEVSFDDASPQSMTHLTTTMPVCHVTFQLLLIKLCLSECARAKQRRPACFPHRICPQKWELRDDPVPAVLVSRLGRLVWSTGP